MGKTHDDSTVRSEPEAPYDPRQSKRTQDFYNPPRPYRVWDWDDKIMHEPPHDFLRDADGNVYRLADGDVTLTEYVLMPHSGRTDKDDSPIYAGDILEDAGHLWVVVAGPGAFEIVPGPDNPMKRRSLNTLWREARKSEVGVLVRRLGNVHQHPHLLESSEDAAEG